MGGFKQLTFQFVGWLSLALGFIGIIIPVLPTTPFLLVAVWAFSKSSPELAEKIRQHPRVGQYIRDWQDHGVIPVRAKILACAMMALSGLYLLKWSPAPLWAGGLASIVMLVIAAYVVSRPSTP
jgi:uncharacterized protein